MKTTNYLMLAAVALAFSACTNTDEPAAVNGGDPIAAQVTGNIAGDNSRSRATNDQWEPGDGVGISTTASTGTTRYANMHYVNSAGGAFAHSGGKQSGIFFQDREEVTFSAYYPFTGEEGKAAGIIEVSTADQTKSREFGFLFAENAKASRSNPALNMEFTHRMARLILKISTDPNSGFDAADVKNGTFYLNRVIHRGTFNTATGIAMHDGNPEDWWQITAPPSDDNDNNIRTYTMIFYPQQGALMQFKAVLNGQDYLLYYVAPNLNSGTSYTCNIKVKKTGLEVSSFSISEWADGGSGSGESTL